MLDTALKTLKFIFSYKKLSTYCFVLLVFISMLLEGISIGLVYPVIEIISKGEDASFLKIFKDIFKTNFNTNFLIILIISIYILKSFYLIFFSWWRSTFITETNLLINKKLYSKYIKLNYEDYLKIDTSIILRNCHEEARKFVGCIEASLLIIIELTVFSIILIPLLYFNTTSTIAILILLSFFSLIFIFFTKNFLKKWASKQIYLVGEIFKSIRQTFQLFKYIKLTNKTDFFRQNYENVVTQHQKYVRNFVFLKQIPKYLIEVILILFICTIFFLNFDQSSIINVIPILALYSAAALRIIPGINRILSFVQVIYNTGPSVQLLYPDLTNLEKTNKKQTLQKEKNSPYKSDKFFKDKIEIKNLYFSYNNSDDEIIKNLNFTIKKGEKICITGESGEGKTTLLDLLLGLLKPKAGKILVDGKDIRENLDSWKHLINFTPQNTILISDTLKNNIALKRDLSKKDEDRVTEVLTFSNLENFQKKEKIDIDYKIGEDAKDLSGGQARRIAIARSLYETGELFIFDEFTSSLDNQTSQIVIKNIFKALKDKTIIVVSHRPQLQNEFDAMFKLINEKEQSFLKKI